MLYNEFKGLKLSALGFGAMRLPLCGKETSEIHEEKALELIELCFEKGINYFDTGYGYHGGQSERFLAKALKGRRRDSFYLADKFPGYDLLNFPDFDRIFEEQLEKCGVGFFDFYLLHNLCELNLDAYLNPAYDLRGRLLRLKEEGKIRHIGVSSHARPETLETFLKYFGDVMEFCQIQLNFMDWEFQNAKEAVALLNRRKLPIWVMEPLRGGTVLNRSTVREAFDFVRCVDGVTMVLSGMSAPEQIEENSHIFSEKPALSENRFREMIQQENARAFKAGIPCTGCGYCVSGCPQKLDIPFLLKNANEFHLTENDFIAPMAIGALPDSRQPKACIGCGACRKVCPQKIDIPLELSSFAKELDEMDEITD